MNRLLLVFVILIVVLVACQSGGADTAVVPTPVPSFPTDTSIPSTPTPEPTAVPPTDTPLPPTEEPEPEPETPDLAGLVEALQAVVDAPVEAGFPGAILMVDAPDMDFIWKGATGMADVEAGIPMEPDTPFRVSGITNMMTAVVVLRLAEEGIIGLDDPINQYLDAGITEQLNGPDGELYGEMITVRQLLNNTSGVAGYFFAREEDRDSNRSNDFLDIILDDPEKIWQPEEVITYTTSNMNPLFAPGEGWDGNDMHSYLLGLIIEAATDASLNAVFHDWLFEPLGMTQTFVVQAGDPKMEHVSHVHYLQMVDISDYDSLTWLRDDVVSTTDDLNRFMWAWVNDEIFTDPVSKEAMKQWISLDAAGYEALAYGLGLLNIDFGKWGMPEIGEIWGHTSVYNGFVFFWPQFNIVFAGTLNQVMPLSAHGELSFATIDVVLPYVVTE